jgi:putative addiction module component (TIGR02574 family)
MKRASILAQALELPVQERARLITELIAADDDGAVDDPQEVEQAWAAELEARIARADADPDDAIDWSELRAQLLAK